MGVNESISSVYTNCSERRNKQITKRSSEIWDRSAYDFYEKFAAAMRKKKSSEPLISSIGMKSLGKSYLLNHIFGTAFTTKDTIDEEKTDCLNDEGLEYCRIMDFEGIGGIATSPRRDHANLCFSLTFSDLVLFHIKNVMIYKNDQFFEKLAFSYWLTIKKLKYNKHKISKILLILRDTEEKNLSSAQENEEKLKSEIDYFCFLINYKIDQYNRRLREILQAYKAKEGLTIDIEELIPYDEEYKFAFYQYHAYGWNNENKTIMEWDGNPRKQWRKLDSNLLRVEISQILEKIAVKPAPEVSNNHSILQSEVLKSNIEQRELLQFFKDECLNFEETCNLKDWIIHEYYLSMELDVGFESNTIEELITKFYILPESFIDNMKERDEFIVNNINNGNEIDIKFHRKKHKTMFENDIKLERVQRESMISILAKNSAYRYSNIMGFTLINLITEISNNNIASYNQIVHATNATQNLKNRSENLILFIIECIFNAPNDEKLIFTEINKISSIKKVFESLHYYNKMIDFYNNVIKKSLKSRIFIAMFCTFIKRVKRVFKPEEDDNLMSKIGDIEEKIASFNFDKYRIHLINLENNIDSLPSGLFCEFLGQLKNYFDTRILKIRQNYNNKDLSEARSVCFLYEKHNSIVSKTITIKTFSEKEILFGGYAVRSLSCLYANADEIVKKITEDEISKEIKLPKNFKLLPQVPLIITSKNWLTGTNLYISSNDTSLLYDDVINANRNLENQYDIVKVDVETRLKNCYYDKTYLKSIIKTNKFVNTVKVKRIVSDLFSAAIFNFYYVLVIPVEE